MLIDFSSGSFLYFDTKPLSRPGCGHTPGCRPGQGGEKPKGEPGVLLGVAGLHRAKEQGQGVNGADKRVIGGGDTGQSQRGG